MAFGAKAFTTDTIAINTALLEGPEKVVVITPDGDKKAKYPTVKSEAKRS